MSARPAFRDRDLQERYDRAGYALVPLLDPSQTARLHRAWSNARTEIHEFGFSASIMSFDQAYRSSVNAVIEEVFQPAIDALFDDYRFCFGNFLAKRAGTCDNFPLHQDLTFVDEERYESINLWVPLQRVDERNGCLRVMPGSHRLNRAPRGTNRGFPYAQLEQLIRRQYLVDVRIEAGWACIMSPRTFHTSYPNQSAEHRLCASALAVPRESNLYYLYQATMLGDDTINVFEVSDTFYRGHVFGEPVPGAVPVNVIPPTADPVDADRLQDVFTTATCMEVHS